MVTHEGERRHFSTHPEYFSFRPKTGTQAILKVNGIQILSSHTNLPPPPPTQYP